MAQMSKAAREAKNEYYKRWRAKNPEKVRESNQKYWERKARERQDKEAQDAATHANDYRDN